MLREVSRSTDGRTVEALRRAIRNLRLVVGAAALTAAAGFVAVVLADTADVRVPTYRAVVTVLVLFVAVLNGTGLTRLDRHDSPVRHTPNPPWSVIASHGLTMVGKHHEIYLMGATIGEVMGTTEALLLGRRTWQTMAAAWPGRAG